MLTTENDNKIHIGETGTDIGRSTSTWKSDLSQNKAGILPGSSHVSLKFELFRQKAI